ncbi:RNA polymerase subunit sigma-70 [bacterium]|nr:RNA polymerase subunit sigma-70 [bacterium]
MANRVENQLKFQSLMEAHQGLIFRVTTTYARKVEDQQDLVQEIKLNLWKAFPKYNPEQSFSTWAYKVSINTAISWFRTHSRKGNTVELPENVPAPESYSDGSAQVLRQLIDNLDPLNRAILSLSLEDLSQSQIAEIIGTTPGNIATRISRIKAQLRHQFEAQEKNSWN